MNNKNKSVILCGPWDMGIQYREMPSVKGDDILIKSTHTCICATEVKYWYYGMPNVPDGTCVVQGHELAGIVADIGEDVKDKSLAEAKVAIDPSIWCGKCDMCVSGSPNLCRELKFMSLPPVDGGYQQYYTVPERNVHRIPDDMPLEWGTIAEPVNVGINAMSSAEKIIGSLSGKIIAVIGAGPQGLLLMQTARAISDPEKVYVLEPLNYRLDLAKELGADEIINPDTESPMEKIIDLTNGKGVDVTFEVSGDEKAYQLSAELVKPGGTVIVVGIPTVQDHIPIKAITARRTGLTISFVRRFNPLDFPKAVDMIASGKVEVEKLITHRFPLDEITPAFEMLHDYSDNVIKTIILPHD
ncbi:zinc-binding dehydrogenase [Candidatus Poribacteria bacterium]|nr:zinc-binding dehydrogenase [Candidatus Poribacteria bacterium]